MINDYASLSTRSGFNKSLGHFRLVSGIVPQMTDGENLADLIDELERGRTVEKSQIAPILNAVVIERLNYKTLSFNLPNETQDFEKIREATKRWNRFDIILAYHHPQLGISLINPKGSAQWESIQEFNREELVVAYIKAVKEVDGKLEEEALSDLRGLIYGDDLDNVDKYFDPVLERKAVAKPPPPPQPVAGSAPSGAPPTAGAAPPTASAAPPTAGAAPPTAVRQPPGAGMPARPAAPGAPSAKKKAAGKEEAPSGGKKRVTPRYSVQVTNELFHNGNVEAWKNIVESYKAKFTALEVHIFHDGQKVNNINALFKWGKVKNGDVILFSVAGEEIKGVAKLQRYLFEGASQRFESYLKKDVNKILKLF